MKRSKCKNWLYIAAIAFGMLVAAVTVFSAGVTCARFDVALSPAVRFGFTWVALMAGFLAARAVFWLANEFEAKRRRGLNDDGPA